MSNVHRIMWIDQEIRQHKYPNCGTLAKHFEISLRQANRDVEYLKCTLNAPIRYIAIKRGFIYDDMTFILPNLIITDEEKKALNYLAHRYDSFDGTVYNQRIAKLFKNLSNSGIDNSRTPIFDINDDRIINFNKISLCIQNKKKLEVVYLEPGGGWTKLILHPYQVYGKKDSDFLIAYCEDYGEITLFRLDRIIKCSELQQRFTVKEEFKAENYINYLKKKPFKAVLQMEITDLSACHLGDKRRKLDDKMYEVEFYDTKQFVRELLISEEWIKIISPGWLIDKLKMRCMDIFHKTND